jgi:hypothetical protein
MQFFSTEPYACDPSSLPQYPPSKEIDAKRRDEEARRYVILRLLTKIFLDALHCHRGTIILCFPYSFPKKVNGLVGSKVEIRL